MVEENANQNLASQTEEKYKVVFVVGAGASVPFQFPTALGLRERVIESGFNLQDVLQGNKVSRDKRYQTRWDPPPTEEWNQISRYAESLEKFYRSFIGAAEDSIDSFVACRNSEAMSLAGRLVTAAHLCQLEREYWNRSSWKVPLGNKPMRRDQDGRAWLDWAFQLIRDIGGATIHPNSAAFITFNYDTVIERELHRMIKISFGHDDDVTQGILKNVPVLHVYGKLATEASGCEGGSKYFDIPQLLRESKDIDLMRSIRENQEWDPRIQRIQRVLASARLVIYLGFSFDPLNVRILGLKDGHQHLIETRVRNKQNVYACLRDVGPGPRRRIATILNWTVDPVWMAEHLGPPTHGAYEFLRDYVNTHDVP